MFTIPRLNEWFTCLSLQIDKLLNVWSGVIMTGQYNISVEGKDPKNPASDEGGGKLTKEAEAAQEVHIISQNSEAAGSPGLMDLAQVKQGGKLDQIVTRYISVGINLVHR